MNPYNKIPVAGLDPRIDLRTQAHPRYHFHGYAGDQLLGDGRFADRSPLGNHAVRGANLSDAQLFANAGYVSTIDPAGGATNSVLRIPNLNFDYSGGQRLIVYWLGIITPEGSDASYMGDGFGTTYPGLRIRAKSTGKVDAALSSASTQAFTAITTGTPLDGTLHSFAFVFDGTAKKYGMWVDEVFDSALAGNYGAFNSGTTVDTRNSNTFQIGSSAPAAAASTDGIVSQTRALHLLRLTASDTLPTVAAMTTLFQQIRANPGKPILGSAF